MLTTLVFSTTGLRSPELNTGYAQEQSAPKSFWLGLPKGESTGLDLENVKRHLFKNFFFCLEAVLNGGGVCDFFMEREINSFRHGFRY